ncbi:MAG: hypothetical protein ACI4BA_03825 [Prevotella sp.]
MMKKTFLTLMAFSAIMVSFSCSSDDSEEANDSGKTNDVEEVNYDEGQRGIVREDQEVDLGLTVTINSKEYRVIFAKSNLTATGLAGKETDFGDYFAWCATEPWLVSYTVSGDKLTDLVWKEGKKGYTWENAPYRNVDSVDYNYMKYSISGETLDMSDDAARQILGGDWQLPSREIWSALSDITHEWISTGTPGYRFTRNDKTLFLPAAGNVVSTSSNNVGSWGFYWANQNLPLNGGNRLAWNLYFTEEGVCPIGSDMRYHGFTIRPVRLVEMK